MNGGEYGLFQRDEIRRSNDEYSYNHPSPARTTIELIETEGAGNMSKNSLSLRRPFYKSTKTPMNPKETP